MICLLSGISSFAIRVFVLVLLIISDRVVAVFLFCSGRFWCVDCLEPLLSVDRFYFVRRASGVLTVWILC